MEGSLPPDLQGTLFRVGPGVAARRSDRPVRRARRTDGCARSERRRARGRAARGGAARRQGRVWYRVGVARPTRVSSGTPTRCWRSPEPGMPLAVLPLLGAGGVRGRADRPDRVARAPGGLRRRPGALRRSTTELGASDDATLDGGRPGSGCASANGTPPGRLRSAQSVALERATWQHDIGVTGTTSCSSSRPPTRLAGRRARQRRALRMGAREPRAGSAWCRGGGGRLGCALDPARPVPGDARARRLRRDRMGSDRPLRVPLRRS